MLADPVAFWKAANGKLAYFFHWTSVGTTRKRLQLPDEMHPLGMYTRCIQACPQPGISSVKGSADKERAEGGGWAPVVHFKHFVDCVATKCLSATILSATALMVPNEESRTPNMWSSLQGRLASTEMHLGCIFKLLAVILHKITEEQQI